jgi:hypothetical protein
VIESVTERLKTYHIRLAELLGAPSHSVSEIVRSKDAHDQPGVYAISCPDDDMVVYVGMTKTKTVAGRIADHRNSNTTSDLGGMLKRNLDLPQEIDDFRIRYVVVQDDRDRLFFEYFAIGCLAPALNK